MRRVSLAVGMGVLSCGLLGGCGGGEAGPGSADATQAKDPKIGQDAMEKMKSMQKGNEIPVPGKEDAGESAQEKMKRMQHGGK